MLAKEKGRSGALNVSVGATLESSAADQLEQSHTDKTASHVLPVPCPQKSMETKKE